MIDFTEIPHSYNSDGQQDQFELFARDIVAAIGYAIIEHPDRGADGGRDILIGENLVGIRLDGYRKWLLSAKHHAHSGKSLGEPHETNIRDRVDRHGAQGFLGLYSTLPSSGLSNAFNGLKEKTNILVDHYDRGLIQLEPITNPRMESVFRAYFPLSYLKCKTQGGYQTTTKDLETTFTGGNAFPVIFYAIGHGVLPNIKNEGQFTLYDLDITISSTLLYGRGNFSRETYPFLHPGSQITGELLSISDVLERRQIESVVAARNGKFFQTATFAPYRHPHKTDPPLITQSHTMIYWQKHDSYQMTLIHNNNTVIQDGDSGDCYVELPWESYSNEIYNEV